MGEDKMADLDTVLEQLRNDMVMCYGASLMFAKNNEERQTAFVSLISVALAIIAAAVTSRTDYGEAKRVVIEQFPDLLTKLVDQKIELMTQIVAEFERGGATVQ